jgi:hypothetical protein
MSYTVLLDANVLYPARLKNPPITTDAYLAILTQQGLVATVAELEQFSELL